MQEGIVTVTEAPLVEKDQVISLAKVAEQRVEAIKKIITAALKVTNEQDWVNLGGKPYLMCSGAEKIARLFGISWTDVKITKEEAEDAKGKWYMYVCSAKFRMGQSEIEAIGTCSSRARFFSIAHGKEKPIEEIDEPSIRKAALTNCIVNGVSRLIGLRNLSWDMIKQAGIDVKKILLIQYKKKEEEKETKESPKQGQLNVKS